MNIMELGAIGELVGGVAVIATLIYLALQVRQSNTQAKMSVVQASRALATENIRAVSEDPAVTELYLRGLAERDALSATDRIRFDMFMIRLFRSWESQFYENRDGFMSDDMWESYGRTFERLMRQPGSASSWNSQKYQLSSSFANWVDGTVLGSEA